MSLIGRFIDRILPVGSITLIKPDGSRETHGPGGGKHVTVKLHDRKAAIDLFRNPRLRLGELYMDRRLTVENGTILDLLELIVGAKPWEQGRRKALGKGKSGKLTSLFRRNDVRKSRKNVAHHYDIGNELYALFLDEDLQYSCAYFTDPEQQPGTGAGRQEGAHRRQARPEAGPARARHRLRLGRVGALPAPRRRSRRARHHAFGRTAQNCPPARKGRGCLRSGQVRADRLPPARWPVRPHRFGRHVRACRRRPLRRILRQMPRAADR